MRIIGPFGTGKKMIYVVLGMHKSGTTLVSQILHHSGIDMGDFDEGVSYDRGNKYERESTLQLDLEILGTNVYEVIDLTPAGRASLTDSQRVRMREIIADCSARHADWGFKDPRAALLYDLWAEELPPHKIIAVFRDPAQVWPRFKWWGKRKYHTNFNRAYSYLHRWQEHNLNILRFLDQTPCETLLLSYHELMSNDAEFRRLEAFIGRKIVDRRQPGLYRNRGSRDVFLRWGDWLMKRRSGRSTDDVMQQMWDRRARELA